MGKVVSDKQRLANRQNARHSTGPKTPTGKARSPRTSHLIRQATFDNRQFPPRPRRTPPPPTSAIR